MESSKPILKTLQRLFPNLVEYTPSDQEKAVDPLIGLMRVKDNKPKYLMRQGRLIGLNLAQTGLTDTQWQEISQSPDFQPGDLQALNLSGNELTVFQLSRGMTALKRLDLSENQLANFELLPGMDKLEELVLEDNPLSSPPKEVMQQGKAAVLRFLRELAEQGVREVYEVKMLIVGEGGTGKTTLWNKLQDLDHPVPLPEEAQPSTIGINVKEGWKFSHLDHPEVPFMVNLWDFGGQQIQYMTHQFFLSRRSFYVLLADGRREVSNFAYWLKIIDLLGTEPDQTSLLPVLVIINERGNKSVKAPYDQNTINNDFPRLEVIRYDLDFAEKDYRLKGLNGAIQDILCHKIKHLPLRIPVKWDKVRERLQVLGKQKNYIDFELYKSICTDCGIGKEDEVQMTDLSQLLHDLGILVHFQEDVSLRDFIVLNPEWAVNAVHRVLKDNVVVSNQGRFNQAQLNSVLTHWGYKVNEQSHLLNLMLKNNLEVCFRAHENAKEIYIAPQLLPELPPENFEWIPEDVKLRYAYQYPFMPKGIIGRLIVRLNEELESQAAKKVVWEKGMVVAKDGCRALVQETEEVKSGLKLIKIEVSGSLNQEDRRYLLRDIRQQLDHIHKRSFPSLRFEEKIPCCCRECGVSENPYFFDLSHLEKLKAKGISTERCRESLLDVSVLELLGEVLVGPEERVIILDPPSSGRPKKIFFSYSKHDEESLKELFKHLATLRRNEKIEPWHDEQVLPGEEWDEKIKKELREAEIIIFLLSSAALNTDYIWDIEIETAVNRHNCGEARVIPLILEHCDWEDTKLGKLNALPQKGKPISAYEKKDEAWKDVVNGIKRVL